jgi:hypothetical protein
MLEIIVAALTQYIEQQNRALPRIDPILDRAVCREKRPRRKRSRRFVRALSGSLLHHCLLIEERSNGGALSRPTLICISGRASRAAAQKRTASISRVSFERKSPAGRRAYAFFKNL